MVDDGKSIPPDDEKFFNIKFKKITSERRRGRIEGLFMGSIITILIIYILIY